MLMQSQAIADPLAQRLRALARETPDLKEAAGFFEAILPRLRDAELHVNELSLPPEEAREKMERGLPLLSGLDLSFDKDAARELMLGLAASVEAIDRKKQSYWSRLPRLVALNASESAASRIRAAIEENRIDLEALLLSVTEEDRGRILETAMELDLDAGLLMTLARYALRPALRAWRGQLTRLAKGVSWRRGTCFVCGAVATLGELRENNQVKHLRCGSCGGDWVVRRIQCMRCGNENHKTQRFLYPESLQERMRVEVCDACKGYVKTISSFTPSSPEMLVVEDLATLHLDYIAQGQGYDREPGKRRFDTPMARHGSAEALVGI